jgi:hypothetical protein
VANGSPNNGEVRMIAPPYTGEAIRIGDIGSLLRFGNNVNSMAIQPSGDGGDLYFGTLDQMLRLSLATKSASVVTTWYALFGRGGLVYDHLHRDFWILHEGGFGPPHPTDPFYYYDKAITISLQGVPQTRALMGYIGIPRTIAVNDFAPGTLNCAPMNVPTTGSFLLEIGLWGNPGEFAVLAMTQPFPLILGTGVFDRAGNWHIKTTVPDGAVQRGSPGVFEFVGASINLKSLQVTTSPPRKWPKN